VVDHQEQWMVVRYIGAVEGKKDAYTMEAAFFNKADYTKWLENEEKKIQSTPIAAFQ
jgi:hypothetical protein